MSFVKFVLVVSFITLFKVPSIKGYLLRRADEKYSQKRADVKCNAPMDLVFALDNSGSIGHDNWNKEIDYVERLIKLLEISDKVTHVGMVDFSTFANVRFNLNAGIDQNVVITDLERARDQYRGDLTSTDAALEKVVDMFSRNAPERKAPRILIIVTDGKTTWKNGKSGKELLRQAVSDLKSLNVTVYAIGVGSRINHDELRYITQDDTGEQVIEISNFNELVISINEILKKYCGGPTTKPTTAPTISTTATTPEECKIRIQRIGCYYDSQRDPRPLPEYILNDRDPTHKSFSGRFIDWKNWNQYFPDFICRCAQKATDMGRKIIGIQYFGECFTSSDSSTYNKDGPRNTEKDCVSFDFKPCKDNDNLCVGAQYHNFVYLVAKK